MDHKVKFDKIVSRYYMFKYNMILPTALQWLDRM